MVLGVDIGGADTPPLLLLEEITRSLADVPLRLYAPKNKIPPGTPVSPLHTLILSSEEILPDEKPRVAVRRKKEASLMLGLLDLKAHKIHALLSLANTGALVLASSFVLGRVPGVHCPAFVAHLPSVSRDVAVLDLGASPQHTASRLKELVLLGVTYAQQKGGSERPLVGLLNIGREETKGTSALREADLSIKASLSTSWEYVGFIEPIDIFQGRVDVAVTDGFTGNVLLKTAEGVYSLLRSDSSNRRSIEKAALLLGVQGDVYKGHGRASPQTLVQVISRLLERMVN